MVTKKVLNDICWKAMSKGAIALYPEELMRLAIHAVRTSPKHVFLNDVQKNILAGKVAALSRKKAGETRWASTSQCVIMTV
ncbi:MAG: hypothetical protein E7572_05305 [Ruminococcaceae bacterium]|jgi:hypothetical protein|nr:hypothetical protein [Oscillospiraceae bacterium]